MNRIYQNRNEIRIEAETRGTLHVTAVGIPTGLKTGQKFRRPKIITIEEFTDEGVDEFNLWVTDIDPLIDALLDMKRELINDYGEAK